MIKATIRKTLSAIFVLAACSSAFAQGGLEDLVLDAMSDSTKSESTKDGVITHHVLENADTSMIVRSKQNNASLMIWCDEPEKNLRVALLASKSLVDIENIRAIHFTSGQEKFSSLLQTKLPLENDLVFLLLVSDHPRSEPQRSLNVLRFIYDLSDVTVALTPQVPANNIVSFSHDELRKNVTEFAERCDANLLEENNN